MTSNSASGTDGGFADGSAESSVPGFPCLPENRQILQKAYPGLLEWLETAETRIPGRAELESLISASGMPTLTANGIYVHSQHDPQKEGQRLAQACLLQNMPDKRAGANDRRPVLVLGFGLGYAAQAVADLAPQRPVVIVEKNPEVLRLAFSLRDLTGFLSRPGIAFVPGGEGEGAIKALLFFENESGKRQMPLLLRNRALVDIDRQWYGAAETRIRSWATQGDVNRATLKKFGARWIKNLGRNMGAIADVPGIAAFLRHFNDSGKTGIPVFLAAAGPSLDGIAPVLGEIRKRCIIVAVDTALRFFLRNGTEPDFAVAVDPQYWNSRHLDCMAGLKPGSVRTRLVAESAVFPPVLRLGFAGSFLCGSLFPLGEFVEKRVDPKGLLGAGGSVATSAWDFCRLLGPKQIWIAGLDLAFPDNKTHFKGALFEENALCRGGRLTPPETLLYSALRSGVPFFAPNACGGQVLTDRRLSIYASWFENSFRGSPEVSNYRLLHRKDSGGGIYISGLENAPLQNLLSLPERRAEIDSLLEKAFCKTQAEFCGSEEKEKRRLRYGAAIAELKTGLEKIKAACSEGKKTALAAMQDGKAGFTQTGETLAALAKADRAIEESGVKQIAAFLLPPEALEETQSDGKPGNDVAAFRRRLEAGLRFYRELAACAQNVLAEMKD